LRGKTNEPALVVHTAARLAALRGVSAAEMARTTTENFLRLFKKVPRSALKAPASAA
jgi:TatD DNase family protein